MSKKSWSGLLEEYGIDLHVSQGAMGTYRAQVRMVRLALGREPDSDDFNRDTINSALIWCEQRYAQRTVAGLRSSINTAWRWCFDHGYAGHPEQIRREKKPNPMPVAWTFDEYQRLLEAAAKLTGIWCGTKASLWYAAEIRVGYETGLRRGNIRNLRQEDFRDDGAVYVMQRKVRKPVVRAVTQDTLALVRQIHNDPVFRVYCEELHYAKMREIVAIAGLSKPGALQMLRRTGATQVAIRYGEDASSKYLGHFDPTTRKYYLDRSQIETKPVMPPT